ncbi:MAG: hypothetical protein ACYDG4_17055 [Desulfuromonadaceae bacterium]
MATSTRVDVTTQLVSTTSLTYIRPIRISVTASLLKPNTKMYAFFDGIDVNQYFTPSGGALGGQLITDSNGTLRATFDVPPMTFATGDRDLLIIDYSNFSASDVVGVASVKARATFSSLGTLQTYQTTETTVITTTIQSPPPNYDPLAQSFFTYGVQGGCFLTSVDLFFLSKDDSLPVWVEVREMVNGYPGPRLIDNSAKSIVNSADVVLSDNGTVATKFRFEKLLYLKQDSDYCFVVRSNSNRYNVFTSKLGETSLETGKVVFEQPYMGSLFKSENNVTWTAEQTEDIKFVLNRADFNTSTAGDVEIALRPSSITINSTTFQTIEGVSKVMVSFPFQHGLRVDSKIAVAVDTTGSYNGVDGTLLNGEHSVTDIIDEYTVAFFVTGAVPTSTGRIETGGLVKDIMVTAGGSGYSDVTPPTVTVEGSGTGATATARLKNGSIESIVVTNAGTGYFGNVSVTITAVSGAGAEAVAYTSPKFTVTTNRVYHSLKPQIDYTLPQGADISAQMGTTTAFFEGGGLSHYGSGKTYDININDLNYFDSNLLIASRFNEVARMGGANSAALNLSLRSSNSNVSPVIDLANSRITLRTNSVNNQKQEVITSTNSSGSVVLGTSGITIVSGGSGYTTAPVVEITGTGTGATATATLTGDVVTSVNVTNGGSGYYGTAKVIFTGGSPTTRATGTVNLTDYNSELKSGFGSALSRYVTKRQILQSASYGAKVFVTAFSNANSSFEVYIKTSLSSSGVDHEAQEWKLLTCDVDRNRSSTSGQFLEYEFYNDSIPSFDVYSLKFVLRTQTPWQPPAINNYRTIILA